MKNILFRVTKRRNRIVKAAFPVIGTRMHKPSSIYIPLLWAILNVALSGQATAFAASSRTASALLRQLNHLTDARDAVLVAAPDGHVLAGINIDQALIPASILKLLTSLTALESLGPDYRFRTDFFIDRNHDLKIKGYGDPLLVSEALKVMAVQLASRLSWVNDLVLDNSYFSQPIRIPGRGSSTEPYDAPNGALCVNFNTVAFQRVHGRWVSDEPQTPLLPCVIPKIEASGLTRGRISMAGNSAEAQMYAGEMFRYFFDQAGLKVRGTIRSGRVSPETDELVWRYYSRHDLREVVADLLQYSNNFIANQILLVMGAKVYGPPATVDKGLKVLNQFYRKDLNIKTGRVVEASGISRENHVTARAMLTILERYKPFHTLMRRNGDQFYKTGHLKGIRTRAGFISTASGKLYPFVVMVNTPGRSTDAIMKIIESFFRNHP